MIHAVIMAGGAGTRFWPRSRANMPKQLLNIVGDKTLIQQTVDRIRPVTERSNIWIVTNASQVSGIREQIPDLPESNILIEPVGRNTAPCIGLAALHIRRRDPEGVMMVLAADHRVGNEELFRKEMTLAVEVARKTKGSVTIGIKPTRPETGYGYIQYMESKKISVNGDSAYPVKTFAEKPNLETAQRFLQSGDFLWNSGIFVWEVSSILELIETHLPELYEGLTTIDAALATNTYAEVLDRVYRSLKGISIDYGVMEKAQSVYVIKGDFDWSDVGSWTEVYNLSEKDADGNVVKGEGILMNSHNSMFYTENKVVAAIGIDNIILVDTPDAILICKRDAVQDVRLIVEELNKRQRNDVL